MDTVAALYPGLAAVRGAAARRCQGPDRDQLALRAGPEHGTVWQLAAHSRRYRVFWVCGIFGEPGADKTPWPSPLTDEGWEDDESHPRSGEELAMALDASWEVYAAASTAGPSMTSPDRHAAAPRWHDRRPLARIGAQSDGHATTPSMAARSRSCSACTTCRRSTCGYVSQRPERADRSRFVSGARQLSLPTADN